VKQTQNFSEIPSAPPVVVFGGPTSVLVRECLSGSGIILPKSPEALAIARGKVHERRVLAACGSDDRGLVYALLELADRVRFSESPLPELRDSKTTAQRPANQIRSVSRVFASDIEDKAWFSDRSFWERYLTELATQRFNRFNLTLGLGYDFPTDIRDAYFHFAYPFLVSVPGYNVRAVPLPDDEPQRNLEMLQFIGEETARRGLHFQLGLWTHAYKWVDSPHANYVIEGLTPETHGPYCREALAILLKACPAINGVTLRIHGESGIAEGSYDFWRTIFDGVVQSGRRVEIDLHAKGIDSKMIDLALATGMPVNVSPKFWAEHMGLGYIQGSIRPQEMPPRDKRDNGFFAMSSGSRSFLRYGYGDLLAENRKYGVLHRIWPGTQRLLLSGDPGLAADYSRSSSFCGTLGVEWLEPLSFKGRKGSGLAGGRDAYADASLRPSGGDFEKYLYTYRVWGRHVYDPDCDPDEWRRFLRKDFGHSAAPVETSLGHASKILPLITTAHCPSAANNNYWPEMYFNMPIVDVHRRYPYSDTPSPKRFGTVSPLDPEFFSGIDDFADCLLQGKSDARYSPLWVANALESSAVAAAKAMTRANSSTKQPRNAPFRRMAADVAIQAGIANFFAWKFRAGVLFAIYKRSNYRPALEQALVTYRKARAAWAEMAECARPIYRDDVTFGPGYFQRGHWLDRLVAIDEDIADMEKVLAAQSRETTAGPSSNAAAAAVEAVLRPPAEPHRPGRNEFHTPPENFQRRFPLLVQASSKGVTPKLECVRLRYRHVNQGELWQAIDMTPSGKTYQATIPADYTDSPFPLQYHFEMHETSSKAWLFPGLFCGWQTQPYFVLHAREA
jgi:hypothetical protein